MRLSRSWVGFKFSSGVCGGAEEGKGKGYGATGAKGAAGLFEEAEEMAAERGAAGAR